MSVDFTTRFRRLAEDADGLGDAERLRTAIDLAWERTMSWSPELATHVGYPDGDHGAWTDLSLAAVERRRAEAGDPLAVLDSIDPDELDDDDRLDYALFRKNVEDEVEATDYWGPLLAIDQLSGVQISASQTIVHMPRRHRLDYEDIVSRLRAFPTLVDQTIELLEAGIDRGWTQPRGPLRAVLGQIDGMLEQDAGDTPFLAPFASFPSTVSEEDGRRLAEEAADAVRSGVVPALERLRGFVAESYLPSARETIAAATLPGGEAWYAFNVRLRTTTDLTPEEIHDIGTSEVERIRSEMEEVIASTGFEGGFHDFTRHVRSDPAFFFDEPGALLAAYRDITKRADAELPGLFGFLPRLPYGVVAVPEESHQSQPAAYYMPGSAGSGRPGYFFANTYALDERPKWEMEALALHEAVPGHHLQIAIAQELSALPEFRRHGGYTAYVEGWGLYAESLGEEMGFYQDPYSRFGRLMFEMWRAIRLVVDTGMHALGWSRERAIAFFRENTGHMGHDVEVEVDRYIVWPGQALAYKIGEIEIKRLRSRAETALGESFDIRAFHDLLLGAGALPLDILARRVDAWIESGATRTPA